MPASVPGSPAPRSPGLALLVEQVARVVARARAQQGDAAVHERVDAAITPEDAATTARVLRILGRELDEAPLDLGALDARLRSIVDGGHADAATSDDGPAGATIADGSDADAARHESDEAAPPPAPGHRPPPPTGLRSAMRRRGR